MEQKQNAFHGKDGFYFAQSWFGIERIRERVRLTIQAFKLYILNGRHYEYWGRTMLFLFPALLVFAVFNSKTLSFTPSLSKISSIIFVSQKRPRKSEVTLRWRPPCWHHTENTQSLNFLHPRDNWNFCVQFLSRNHIRPMISISLNLTRIMTQTYIMNCRYFLDKRFATKRPMWSM